MNVQDTEAEVRIAAAAKVAALCKLCSSEASLEQILPSVKELAADNNQHVRAALASVIMALAPGATADAAAPHWPQLGTNASAGVFMLAPPPAVPVGG